MTRLESINIDGNPATTDLLRSEGALETLFVSLFTSLAEIGDEDLNPVANREEYLMSRNALLAMTRAVQTGDEAVLLSLLRLPPHRQAPQASALDESPFKVTELLPPQLPAPQEPSNLISPTTAQNAASAALSKADKMEMWKRIQDERKALEQKEKDRLKNETMTVRNPPSSSLPSISTPSVVASQSMNPAQYRQVPVDLPLPPPPSSSANDLRVSAPQQKRPQQQKRSSSEIQTAESNTKSENRKALTEVVAAKSTLNDRLVAQVHSLQEQVSTLRKYIKVSFSSAHRDRMTRNLMDALFLGMDQARADATHVISHSNPELFSTMPKSSEIKTAAYSETTQAPAQVRLCSLFITHSATGASSNCQ